MNDAVIIRFKKMNKILESLNNKESMTYSRNFDPNNDDYDRNMELEELLNCIDLDGTIEAFVRLIELNSKLKTQLTYINASVSRSNILKFSIESNIFDLNQKDRLGFTLLYRFCSYPEKYISMVPESVKTLLDAGVDPNIKCDAKYEERNAIEMEYTPLMKAALCDSGKVIEHLLDAGADTSICNFNGKTALDLAQKKKRMNAVAILEGF